MARYRVSKVDYTQDSKPQPEGFRYSRPAPYLVVTNMGFSALTAGQSATPDKSGGDAQPPSATDDKRANDKKTPTLTVTQQVTATLIWLPDYEEQYAVTVVGGRFGTFTGSLSLTDGWMLTGVNQTGDSKTAENLTALSGLITGVVSSAVKGGAAGGTTLLALPVQLKSPELFFYLFKIDLKANKLSLVGSTDLEAKFPKQK